MLLMCLAVIVFVWIAPMFPQRGQPRDLPGDTFGVVVHVSPSDAYLCQQRAVEGENPRCEAARSLRDGRFNVWRAGLLAAVGCAFVGFVLAIWSRRRRLFDTEEYRAQRSSSGNEWVPDDDAWDRHTVRPKRDASP
ncbi:MAG: hypothetical protein ABIQ73_20040 [Acidimicrobiales bacterium]